MMQVDFRSCLLMVSFVLMGKLFCFSQTVMDADSNSYPTVTIGDHVWMAENLKTTRYNDGSYIQQVPDSSSWSTATFPGFCWYSNTALYKDKTGALYNWHAVNSGKLAPAGWHVASDAEWKALTDTLGGVLVAGGLLKEKGTIEIGTGFWYSPNEGATNKSGFSARGGGSRDLDGSFFYLFSGGYFWTSAPEGTDRAFYRQLSYNYADVLRGSQKQQAGMSVRCIRDTGPGIAAKRPGPFSLIVKENQLVVNFGMGQCPVDNLLIYNASGKRVQESPVRCPLHSADITQLPAGLYILLLTGERTSWSYQFIKF